MHTGVSNATLGALRSPPFERRASRNFNPFGISNGRVRVLSGRCASGDTKQGWKLQRKLMSKLALIHMP